MFLSSLSLLLCWIPWMSASITLPQNVCSLDGPLAVTSVPCSIPVDAAHCNKIYNKTDFQQQPVVKYILGRKGQRYTLLMLDPDAPNRTEDQYYLHWILANIEGGALRMGDLSGSTEIASYLGPAPPEGTGLHRYMYILLVHRLPSQRVVQAVGDLERQFFNLKVWLASLQLQGVRLRGPVSGVQFRSGFCPAP